MNHQAVSPRWRLERRAVSPGPHLRRIVVMIALMALTAACGRELLPGAPTRVPTGVSQTPTPLTIEAPVVRSPGIVSIRMIDEYNGWAVSDTAILRTADGGSSWHDVSPTAAKTFGYSVAAHFLDLQHAWLLLPDPADLLAGTLYRTGDGGVTWIKTSVPFGGGDLHFLDFRQGWMMASLGAGAGSMGVAVFQTTDGGSTWSQAYVNDPNRPGAGDSLPLGGLKDAIVPMDMRRAWIGGVTYTPGRIYLYQTRDAGRSWQQSPVAPPAGYEQAELETTGPILITSQVAYLPVHVSSQNGIMLAIYVSRDGGNSWIPTPTLIPQGGSADFVSEQSGFVWNGIQFYVTNDAAQTWSGVLPDVSFGASFAAMDFVNARLGFVVTNDAAGTRGLYKTTDGAATWNLLGP